MFALILGIIPFNAHHCYGFIGASPNPSDLAGRSCLYGYVRLTECKCKTLILRISHNV